MTFECASTVDHNDTQRSVAANAREELCLRSVEEVFHLVEAIFESKLESE